MNVQKKIIEKIKTSDKIVITSHISPDGDSIGSSLALYFLCKELNKDVVVCHPDPAPDFLNWIEGFDEIINFEKNEKEVIKLLDCADLIFCLDYNQFDRVGEKMHDFLKNSKSYKIMIDHHLNPSDAPDIVYSDASSCSTCQLIFELIEKSENLPLLNKTIGTAIYLGIMTDTGSFRYNSVKPYTHEIIAQLLLLGVKNDEIHEKVFDVNNLEKLKLRAFAISEKLIVDSTLNIAYISLSKDELKKYNSQKGDTEGLVNIALSIEGIKIAAFFSEDEEKIKISFRSKGKDNPVNVLSSTYFSGGGHANAAGGKFVGNLTDAIDLFLKVIPEYV